MSSTPDQPAATPEPVDPAPAGTPAEAPQEDGTATDGTATTGEDAGEATADATGDAGPQDVTLLVDPARVRRAPRYPVFLWMGALVGIVVGLGFATWLVGASGAGQALMKPGVYVTVVVLATTALGIGVAGLLALLADRRSLRRR